MQLSHFEGTEDGQELEQFLSLITNKKPFTGWVKGFLLA
jgi:hypothetical protein